MSIRTDLAIELKDSLKDSFKSKESFFDYGIKVSYVSVLDEVGQRTIGKPVGEYITIDAPAILDRDIKTFEYVSKILQDEIKKMLPKNEFTALVVGLGNRDITPDSLGTETVSKLMVTRHVKDLLPKEIDFNSVCAITPGVLGITGIESAKIVQSVCKTVSPDVVIVIDALAARSIDRIGTTFQITDTGISPGSGIGNKRIALNEQTLNCKVIAIGVPMVVYSSTIVEDMICDLTKKGNIDESFIKSMIDASFAKENMVVTPKEIDVLIHDAAGIIANSLNLGLHKNISKEFVDEIMH